MAGKHGKGAVIKLSTGTTGSTAVKAVNADDVSYPIELDEAEVTVFGSTFRSYVPGMQGGSLSISGPWDSTLDARMSGIMGATKVTYEYSPASTSTGNPSYTGTAVLTSYEIQTPALDRVSYTAQLRLKTKTRSLH